MLDLDPISPDVIGVIRVYFGGLAGKYSDIGSLLP
jgi:hypothetical protein